MILWRLVELSILIWYNLEKYYGEKEQMTKEEHYIFTLDTFHGTINSCYYSLNPMKIKDISH